MLLFASLAISASGQEKRASPLPRRVEFHIHDGSGDAGRGTFRDGNKVPYITRAASATQGPQYNYAETGVNIEAIPRQ